MFEVVLSHWRAVTARLLARYSDRRAALVLGAAILAVVPVAAGVYVLRTRAQPVELTLPRAAATTAVSSDTDIGSGASGAPEGDVAPVAHAAGAVVRPGIYPLPSGARVADLLAAAGGPTRDADLDAINLAAKVADGDRIYVPRRGEVAPSALSGASGAGGGAAAPTTVNLNSASLEELDSLPGVGPATAQAILDYRRQHGRFRSVDQLLEVRGIGQAKLRQIRPRVRV